MMKTMKDCEDDLLLESYALGERASLDELVRRHHAAARRLASAMLGDSAAAEDAVQEAFIALAETAPRFKGRGFAAWWHGILSNKIKMERRRRATKLRHEQAYRSRQRRAAGPESPAVELRDALSALPSQQQSALVLKYYEGCSEHEIADRLGCSRATAGRRIRSGLERLRRGLGVGSLMAIPDLEALLRSEAPPPNDADPSRTERLVKALRMVEPRAPLLSGLGSLAIGVSAIVLVSLFAMLKAHEDRAAMASNLKGQAGWGSAGFDDKWGPGDPELRKLQAELGRVRAAPRPAAKPEAAPRPAPPPTPAALAPGAIIAYDYYAELDARGGAAAARLRYQLFAIDVDGASMRQVLAELSRLSGLPLLLSPELEGLVNSEDHAVVARLEGVSLGALLRQIVVFDRDRVLSIEPQDNGAARLALVRPSVPAPPAVPSWPVGVSAEEHFEDQARARQLSFAFQDRPLLEVLEELRASTRLSFVVPDGLELEGRSVTAEARDTGFEEGLELILRPLGFQYRGRHFFLVREEGAALAAEERARRRALRRRREAFLARPVGKGLQEGTVLAAADAIRSGTGVEVIIEEREVLGARLSFGAEESLGAVSRKAALAWGGEARLEREGERFRLRWSRRGPDLRAIEEQARSRAAAVVPSRPKAQQRLSELLRRAEAARAEADGRSSEALAAGTEGFEGTSRVARSRGVEALSSSLRAYLLAEAFDPRGIRRSAGTALFLVDAVEGLQEAARLRVFLGSERSSFERLGQELREQYRLMVCPDSEATDAPGRSYLDEDR